MKHFLVHQMKHISSSFALCTSFYFIIYFVTYSFIFSLIPGFTEHTFLLYLNSHLKCRFRKDWGTVYVLFSPFVLAVLDHFPQGINSEMEIFLQVDWLVLLETTLLRERKAELSRGKNWTSFSPNWGKEAGFVHSPLGQTLDVEGIQDGFVTLAKATPFDQAVLRGTQTVGLSSQHCQAAAGERVFQPWREADEAHYNVHCTRTETDMTKAPWLFYPSVFKMIHKYLTTSTALWNQLLYTSLATTCTAHKRPHVSLPFPLSAVFLQEVFYCF